MKKTNKKATEKELAAKAGTSSALAGRKRRRGKTDSEIITEAQIRRDIAACAAEPVEGESFAAAQRRKESALADLRQLEHRQKSAELVDVRRMELAWAAAGQTLRDAFLALPEQVAPQLAALSDARQVRDILRSEVHKILSNLPGQIRNGSEGRKGQTQ